MSGQGPEHSFDTDSSPAPIVSTYLEGNVGRVSEMRTESKRDSDEEARLGETRRGSTTRRNERTTERDASSVALVEKREARRAVNVVLCVGDLDCSEYCGSRLEKRWTADGPSPRLLTSFITVSACPLTLHEHRTTVYLGTYLGLASRLASNHRFPPGRATEPMRSYGPVTT